MSKGSFSWMHVCRLFSNFEEFVVNSLCVKRRVSILIPVWNAWFLKLAWKRETFYVPFLFYFIYIYLNIAKSRMSNNLPWTCFKLSFYSDMWFLLWWLPNLMLTRTEWFNSSLLPSSFRYSPILTVFIPIALFEEV